MGAQLRAVRQRIRSIQSTAKITRAQELIAASRIIKAQQRVRDAVPYAREITRAVEAAVSKSAQIDHPIIREPDRPQRAALLILTSDRGFAGGYNANVLRSARGSSRASAPSAACAMSRPRRRSRPVRRAAGCSMSAALKR